MARQEKTPPPVPGENGASGKKRPCSDPTGAVGGPEWREHLHRLDGGGLVLLPIGAKPPDRKVPVDPETGYGLEEWQNHPGFTAAAIAAMDPRPVIGACINTGPSGLDVLDIDGPAAVAWLEARGLDPRDPALFRITRTTDPDRFKIPFRLTPKQRSRLPQTKVLLRVGEKDADGKRQALELYAKQGAQVIVLGFHTKSGGWYDWAGDPAHIGSPSEEWMAALIALCSEVESLRGKGDTSRPPRTKGVSSGCGGWQGSGPRHPCPVCGRNTSAACTRATASNGRRLVSCYHGGQFSAPEGLNKGDTITGRDGQQWAFVEAYNADCIGEKSLFIDHQPSRSNTATLKPPPHSPGGEPPQQQPSPVTGYSRPIKVKHHEILRFLPDRLGGQPRLNIRTRDVHLPDGILSTDEASRLYLQLCSEHENWPKEATFDAVQLLAAANCFDPVAEYLERVSSTIEPLPLEQWNRLDWHLLGTDDDLAGAFLRQFLISAVARTFSPGCSVRRTPVLIGPQWRGKTALGRILFGADHWVEGIHGSNDRDVRTRCHTAWGVELAELNGITRKRDQEELKAFLTERTDVLRRVYIRGEERLPRRFVFWGTSNGPPLRDATGATRFVCIQLPDRMLPLDWAADHRDAIWSRAVDLYRAEVPWDESSEDERDSIAERNDQFRETHPWEEPIAAFLEHRKTTGTLPVKVPEVLAHLGVTTDRQHAPGIASTVRELAELAGWKLERRQTGGERVRGLWPPEAATTRPNLATPLPGPKPTALPVISALPQPATTFMKVAKKETAEQEQNTNRGTVGAKSPASCGTAPKAAPRQGSSWPGSPATVVPPATTATTPPVGSGSDVAADGEDPHWPPRSTTA
jgi:hypothetical protein